jgi:DNA-binding GntR family transcriptional regulator
VAAELRRALADGEVVPGERHSPAKDLARILGIDPNTVFDALGIFRTKGFSNPGVVAPGP